MTTVWVLIVFLKYSYSGGVVAVPKYISQATCERALATAMRADTFQDGFCLQTDFSQ